jgi:hypothetical protein
MKNKGIIVSGGELNATNLINGEKSTIIGNANCKDEKGDLTKENLSQLEKWKEDISNGNLKDVISSMLEYLKAQDDKRNLNAVIIQSAALNQLDMQENLYTISHEQAKIDRSNISNSILKIIDNVG